MIEVRPVQSERELEEIDRYQDANDEWTLLRWGWSDPKRPCD